MNKRGSIAKVVRDEHFSRFPKQLDILKSFLHHFNIDWANNVRIRNTDLSFFLLEPHTHIMDAHGIEREVLLVYSQYATMQPRTIQAIDDFFDMTPAKGRVEPMLVLLVSEDPNVDEWIFRYMADYQESRSIVPFYSRALLDNSTDYWYIRNILNKHLYNRDLFDFRLPLRQDIYYFGRSTMLDRLLDFINRKENIGLFGLRKTGKTSLLYKLMRYYKSDENLIIHLFDSKNPSIRMRRWYELLKVLADNLVGEESVDNFDWSPINASTSFAHIIESFKNKGKQIAFIFDEIEYITPFAIDDKHWQSDFTPFWQTLWTIQSINRNISFIVAGVNPTVVEKPEFNNTQNPLFGLIKIEYLTGLSSDEVRMMLETLGKKMGLKFDHSAKSYIYEQYGGHPYLTRLACSMINRKFADRNESRPIHISGKYLMHTEEERLSELAYYSNHVVAELEKFYPDEYSMLELLATDQIGEYIEYSRIPEFTSHIKNYGLVIEDEHGRPSLAIPAISRYIATQAARNQNRYNMDEVIANIDKESWVARRIQSIIQDTKYLNSIINHTSAHSLFGNMSLPDADEVISIKPCHEKECFIHFIILMNKVFVESLKSLGVYQKIKLDYPLLWAAMERIRIMRNRYAHRELTPENQRAYEELLKRDYPNPPSAENRYFIYQYKVLDELFIAIQGEIARVES